MRIALRGFVFVLAAVIAFLPEDGMTSNSIGLAPAVNAQKGTTQDRIVDRDDGSGLSFEDDKPRVDQFARNLINVPETKGYVIAYSGLVGPPHEAKTRLTCIRKYLARSYKLGRDRLVLIDGGYRLEVSVELFVVRPGETIPTPQPMVSASAVRVVKPKKGARPCN
jgi:hypothetical protein